MRYMTCNIVDEVLASSVYVPFQAGVVVTHYAQYPRNPVVRFLPTTLTNLKSNLFSTPRLLVTDRVTGEATDRNPQ
jgi:hypothetical protein